MATNYEVFTKKVAGENYRIIKTLASNIKAEIINKPVTETNYYGVNGGFFIPQIISY